MMAIYCEKNDIHSVGSSAAIFHSRQPNGILNLTKTLTDHQNPASHSHLQQLEVFAGNETYPSCLFVLLIIASQLMRHQP
jgi:hypothetical protein